MFRKLISKHKSNFRVVILGCQRSGTTLLKEIISAGQIFMIEENWIWSYFYRERWHAGGIWHHTNKTTKEQQIWDKGVKKFIKATYDEYYQKLKKSRHHFWGIKAPGLNMAMTVFYLEHLFPDLKFIIIVRDPRDTFVSMLSSPKMLDNLPENFYNSPFNSPDLVELYYNPYGYWGKVYFQVRKFLRLKKEKCFIVNYEKMLEQPSKTVLDICSFLKIGYSTNMIEPFCRNISNASVVSMSIKDYKKGNYSVSKSPVGRWREELGGTDYIKLSMHSGEEAKKWGYII